MGYSNTSSYTVYFIFMASFNPCVNHVFLVLYFNFTFYFGKCLLYSNSNIEWNHPNAAWVSDSWYISFQSKLARSSLKASLFLCDIFLLYMKSSFAQSVFSKDWKMVRNISNKETLKWILNICRISKKYCRSRLLLMMLSLWDDLLMIWRNVFMPMGFLKLLFISTKTSVLTMFICNMLVVIQDLMSMTQLWVLLMTRGIVWLECHVKLCVISISLPEISLLLRPAVLCTGWIVLGQVL